MAREHLALFTRRRIPHASCQVLAGRREECSVRREGTGQYRRLVARQHLDRRACGDVPQAHGAVMARRRYKRAVRGEYAGVDRVGMPDEHLPLRARRDLPHSCRLRLFELDQRGIRCPVEEGVRVALRGCGRPP